MQGRENKRSGSQSHELLLLRALGGIRDAVTDLSNAGFQMQFLRDANGDLVWVEVVYLDGVKTYEYYDSPAGNPVVPVMPLQPVALGTDAELITDDFIAVATDLINGYSIGDEVSRISLFDLTGPLAPLLISSFWFNKSTNTILTTVDVTDLEDQDGPIITTPGTGGFQVTIDGTYPFSFDADSISIENLTPGTITVTIDGVLGNDFYISINSAKDIVYDVAKATGVIISGITGGEVLVTYNRGK